MFFCVTCTKLGNLKLESNEGNTFVDCVDLSHSSFLRGAHRTIVNLILVAVLGGVGNRTGLRCQWNRRCMPKSDLGCCVNEYNNSSSNKMVLI